MYTQQKQGLTYYELHYESFHLPACQRGISYNTCHISHKPVTMAYSPPQTLLLARFFKNEHSKLIITLLQGISK